jgi:hypothetical protein
MARPIEPTPILEGEDAERLLRDLENVCSPEEARRRSNVPGAVTAYVSLLVDEVVLETRERKKLALGSHNHPIVPALKIATLGVSASFRAMNRGAGEALMSFAFVSALDVADYAGCRAAHS